MQLELAENNNNFPYVFVPLRDGSGVFIHEDKLVSLEKGFSFKKFLKSIGKVADKVVKGTKKIGLSVPRNAFLGIVKLNVMGLATKMDKAKAKGKGDELRKFWENLGGNNNKLNTAINEGKKHKQLFDDPNVRISLDEDNPLAEIVTATTAVATSTPIIVAIKNFLIKHAPELIEKGFDALAKKAGAHGIDEVPDPITDGEHYEPEHGEGSAASPDGSGGFDLKSPLVIGGIALIALMLLKRR